MTTSILVLPEHCWSIISYYVGPNGISNLVSSGCRRLTRVLQRGSFIFEIHQTSGRFLDLNTIFRNASYVTHLRILSVVGSQRLVWPIALGILPRRLTQLYLTCPYAVPSILHNAALSFTLPSLRTLHLISTDRSPSWSSSTKSVSFANLPHSLTQLSIEMPTAYALSVYEINHIPTSVTALGFEGRLGPPGRNAPDFCLALRRRLPLLAELYMRASFCSLDFHPSADISFLPPSLTSLTLQELESWRLPLETNFIAQSVEEYVASEPLRRGLLNDAPTTLDLIAAGQLTLTDYERSILCFSWKEVFPKLRYLGYGSLKVPLDALQYFSSEMTYLNVEVPTPTMNEEEEIAQSLMALLHHGIPHSRPEPAINAHWKLKDFPTMLESWSTKNERLHSTFFASNFSSLQTLKAPNLTLATGDMLPKTIIRLTLKHVSDINALPSSLLALEIGKSFDLPSGSALDHRGLPSTITTLTVGTIPSWQHMLWLSPSLNFLSASLPNALAWLTFVPSDPHWHDLIQSSAIVLPRSHPGLIPSTDDAALVFLPKLERLEDTNKAGSIRSCHHISSSIRSLTLSITSNAKFDVLEGLERTGLTSLSIQGSMLWIRLDKLIERLPSSLRKLSVTNALLDVYDRDLLRLPQLETLILHADNYVQGRNERNRFFDPAMSAALPRSLLVLDWQIAIYDSVKDAQVRRFADALPPRMRQINIHKRVNSYYYSKAITYDQLMTRK